MPRSSYYYEAVTETQENLRLMRQIDETYLRYPFFGSRQMTRWLERKGLEVNRKRIQRLMRKMGLEAIYQRPQTSRSTSANSVYPYLLRDLVITKANHVWATDITYIPIRGGYVYLCAVLDWASRFVLSWELSNSLNTTFACVRSRPR